MPPLDDFTVVRRRMAKARKAAGLTQEGLAEDAGVAIDVVKYWETGRLTMVLPKDSPNLRALCLVLDVEAARKALGADSVEPAAILEGLL